MKITVSQLRNIIAEEIASVQDSERFLHGGESGQPFDDEASMIKGQMLSIKQMATQVCDMLESGDQLPAWLQSHVTVAHENLRQAHGYLMGDAALDSAAKELRPMRESYSRITQEEMSAWMKGDWGFVSDFKESASFDDEGAIIHQAYMNLKNRSVTPQALAEEAQKLGVVRDMTAPGALDDAGLRIIKGAVQENL